MNHVTEAAGPRPAPPDFIVGVDLGQIRDHTAVVVLERRERPAPGQPIPGPPSFVEQVGLAPRPPARMEAAYAARWIERLPLDTPYPDQVRHVTDLVRRLRETMDRVHPGRLAVVLDATGAGLPVSDMFRQADLSDARLVPVTITGGDTAHPDGRGGWRTPKRGLVGVVQVLLQTKRITITTGMPAAATLEQELRGFRAKITLTGHDQYAAGEDWRSAPHDDLVLALAVAAWYGEHAMAGWPAAMSQAMEEAMSWQSRPE